ncbi:MAG: AraC family transcriptional regulator [Clostridia bacterium]|nr:AraC family transcriptional regulator [Clostridia bacterium]
MEFKIKKFSIALDVSGIVNVHFFEFEQQFKTEKDNHPFAELLFVNSGKMEVTSDGFTGTLSRRDFIIHPANMPHSLRCRGDAPASVIIIGFKCDSEAIAQFSSRPTRLNETDVKRLAEIVKEGRNVFAPPYNVSVYDMKKKKDQIYGSEQLLKNLLENFLIGLMREELQRDGQARPRDDEPVSTEVVRYIDDNFLEKITIDELAFLFRTNRSTLCKEFKNATGKTLIGYVNEKKLAAAKEKIVGTNKTFTEIAEQLNFDTIHYFTRFFKKHTGCTPKEYRSRYQK